MEILNHVNRHMAITWSDDYEIIIHIAMHTIAEYQFDRVKSKEAGDYVLKGMQKLMRNNRSYTLNNLYQMASDLKALYKVGVPIYSYKT